MKYIPLDLSVMQPEPFPHPVMMRSDLYPRRQPSREEEWGICPGSVCGALRALVWSEKDTRMLQSLLRRYQSEGERMLAHSGVYVCSVCGFVYVGDAPPELCPVCTGSGGKVERAERRI